MFVTAVLSGFTPNQIIAGQITNGFFFLVILCHGEINISGVGGHMVRFDNTLSSDQNTLLYLTSRWLFHLVKGALHQFYK